MKNKNKVAMIMSFLVAVFLSSQVIVPIFATTLDELREEQQQLEEGYGNTNDLLENMNDELSSLQTEIGTIDDELVLMLASISMLEDEMASKEVEIQEAQEAYNQAKSKEEEHNNAMMVRIRCMYETGNISYMEILMNATNFSELLNKMDYVDQLYVYDRNLLESYKEIKENVASTKEILELEYALLQVAMYEYEQEKVALDELLEIKKGEVDNYEVVIAQAKQDAIVYRLKLEQQMSKIQQLEEEERKREEEEAAQNQSDSSNNDSSNDDSSNDDSSNDDSSNGDSSNGDSSNNDSSNDDSSNGDSSNNDSSNNDSPNDNSSNDDSTNDNSSSGSTSNSTIDGQSIITNATGSALGKEIALYAIRFVGNPYVLGGTSLTEGADCSGFTYSVYGAFGYKIPRTSTEQRSAGVGVSYAEAQPGDLICYSGHVALYIGNGMIVHASTEATGIKYGTATYRTILAVRRIVNN